MKISQKKIAMLSISTPLVRRTSRGKESVLREADMTNQHTTSRDINPIVGAVFIGLAIVLLLGKLDGPAAQLINLLGTVARQTLVLLPSLLLTASQALRPEAFDHQHISLCAFGTLVFWPLLQTAAKVA